jgi:Flp pilus assembly protein TadD
MHLKRHLSYIQGYLELGLVAEAATELERIPSPHSDLLEVVSLRMTILHEQENWGELASVAAEYVNRAPADPAPWVMWAYATRRCVSLDAAERILLEAERQHPTEPTIQFNLGCYACLRGDLGDAQRRVDRAVTLDSRFADAAAKDPDLAALRNAASRRTPHESN